MCWCERNLAAPDSPIGKKRPLRRRNAVDYTVLEAELAAAPAKAVFESKRRVKGSKPANGRKPTKQGPADPRRRKEKTGKENSKEKKKKPAVLSPAGRSIKPVSGPPTPRASSSALKSRSKAKLTATKVRQRNRKSSQ